MLNLKFRLTFLSVISLFVFLSFILANLADFKTEQLKNSRVKEAYKEKEEDLKELFKEKGVNFSSQQIFFRSFKAEEEIELWARSSESSTFKLIKTYNICSSSGSLGPKRKQGDNQTPEGFYYIDRFNPNSSFHLSLGVNYPNASDKILGDKTNYGGDIFIHGSCVTIGCIPLTNDKIKEVYITAVEAKTKGQKKIQVHIFPCRLNDKNIKDLKNRYSTNASLIAFWENLKTGYDIFERTQKLPVFTVNTEGKYKFN
jgi:murein L,D-transpeptidase YafK